MAALDSLGNTKKDEADAAKAPSAESAKPAHHDDPPKKDVAPTAETSHPSDQQNWTTTVASDVWHGITGMANTIGSVAKTAATSAECAAVAGFPKFGIAFDNDTALFDDAKNWNFGDNDAAVKASATTPKGDATVQAGAVAAAGTDASKAPDQSAIDKSFSWLTDKWDNIFKKPSDTNAVATGKDTKGETATAVHDGQVDHKSGDNSQTHVDAKTAEHVSKGGDKSTMDKTAKTLTDEGVKGAKAVYDVNTHTYTIQDGDGNSIKLAADGKTLIATDKSGNVVREIHNDRVVARFRETETTVTTARKGQEAAPDVQNGVAAITNVQDTQDPHKQATHVSDGKGTTVDSSADNRGVVTMNKGTKDEMQLFVKPGSDEQRLHTKDGDYIVSYEDGKWGATKDGKPVGDLKRGDDGTLNIDGHVIHVSQDGFLQVSASTRVSADGRILVVDQSGKEIDIHGGKAVLKDANGAGMDASLQTANNQVITTTKTPDAVHTTTVNTDTGAVSDHWNDGKGGPDHVAFENDPTKPADQQWTFGTRDGVIHGGANANGQIDLELWNHNRMCANGTETLADGTVFNANDGTVLFDDGTFVDSNGTVEDANGDRIGSAKWASSNDRDGDGDNDDFRNTGAAAASQAEGLIGSAQSLAETIRASVSQGHTDGGAVGQLLSVYSQLGAIKGELLQQAATSFNISAAAAASQVDSEQADVGGAISAAQIGEAQKDIALSLTSAGADPMILSALQRAGSGGDAKSIEVELEKSGVISKPKDSAVATTGGASNNGSPQDSSNAA